MLDEKIYRLRDSRQVKVTVDTIEEIGIEESGRIYIKPSRQVLLYIYRTATAVHWNESQAYLYSPIPIEFSYFDWYQMILTAAKEQGCELIVSDTTTFKNIPDKLQAQILNT